MKLGMSLAAALSVWSLSAASAASPPADPTMEELIAATVQGRKIEGLRAPICRDFAKEACARALGEGAEKGLLRIEACQPDPVFPNAVTCLVEAVAPKAEDSLQIFILGIWSEKIGWRLQQRFLQ